MGGAAKEAREKKVVKVKRLKDKDGLKGNKNKINKALKEKKKLKRKKPSGEENSSLGTNRNTPGGPTAGEGGGGPVKKVKMEVGAGDKPVKKKFKRKDKVQIKVNKDGFEVRPCEFFLKFSRCGVSFCVCGVFVLCAGVGGGVCRFWCLWVLCLCVCCVLCVVCCVRWYDQCLIIVCSLS